jgi:AmiR/NasT family two-component response regulator
MARTAADHLSRLTLTLVAEPDEQGATLLRELQRTRARVTHRWPMPERVGENADIVLCEYAAGLAGRLAWMPGEATAALVVLLPQGGGYDLRELQAATPDAVLHRPYVPHAVLTALTIAYDHFSFCRRQRTRLARLDENVRSLRDIERAKHIIMADGQLDEHKAFDKLRSMAMARRMTVAALAASLVDSGRSRRLP